MLKINSLFYADDGMILTNSLENAGKVIDEVVKTSRNLGLEINKQKSKIIIFNVKEKPEMIGGINITDKIKYLGITINDSKNCFKAQKEKIMEKARKMANMTYSVIAKSCSKLLIGKTYWKSVALPSILYGINIMDITNTDIRKLQSIENGVFRQILGAPGYAQEEALRGEIGASSMKTRLREGQLKFLRYAMEGRNDLLRRIAEEICIF